MPTIFANLDLARQSLSTQQYALSVTQRNVANLNNSSYTRQEVEFTGAYTDTYGNGMPTAVLEANRNRYLDCNIAREQSGLGQSSVSSEAMSQIDTVMNNLDENGLQEVLADFFNSFGSLSSNPTDLNLRQQALISANALTGKFHKIYNGLQQIQATQDQSVERTVDDINSLTSKIADINKKISVAHRTDVPEQELSWRDERQKLVEELAQKIQISYYENDSGSLMITTEQGGPLVQEYKNSELTFVPDAGSGFYGVALEGQDITASLDTGELGAYLKLRDETIPGYLNALDELAAGIISRVNAVHTSGDDLDGNPGGNFFVPAAGTGAAKAISVALADARGVAAAASGSGIANNENAKLLAAIGDEKIFSGDKETAYEIYEGLIFKAGSDAKTAEDSLNTQNNLLEQLANRRSSTTGVSMDEEAVNMLKYQRTYQACARFANVLDDLCQDILQTLGS